MRSRASSLATLALALSGCDASTSAVPASDTTAAVHDAAAPAEDVAITLPDPTTWLDVQPVYQKYCGGCHGGQGSGQTDFALRFEDAIAQSNSCQADPRAGAPKTVARCAVDRVASGTMPPGGVHIPDADYLLMREFVVDGLLEAP